MGLWDFRMSYDLGFTFFDTAEGYGDGDNEVLLGEAVKPFRVRNWVSDLCRSPHWPAAF